MLWRQGSLVISPMPQVFLFRLDIISLVVREGFERVPTLVEHPNGGVQISLHAIFTLLFTNNKVENVLSSSQEPSTTVVAIWASLMYSESLFNSITLQPSFCQSLVTVFTV
jgi:hypothetical protein